jgi:hypothetical protein
LTDGLRAIAFRGMAVYDELSARPSWGTGRMGEP